MWRSTAIQDNTDEDGHVVGSLVFDGVATKFEVHFTHLDDSAPAHEQPEARCCANAVNAQNGRERPRAALADGPARVAGEVFRERVARLACLHGGRGLVVDQTAAQCAVDERLQYCQRLRNPASPERARERLAKHDLGHE